MKTRWALAALLAIGWVGCADNSVRQAAPEKASSRTTEPAAVPATAGDAGNAPRKETPGTASRPSASEPPVEGKAPSPGEAKTPSSGEAKAPQQGVTRQVAKTGVGKRGRSLEGKTGIARVIAQPARTLFVVEQRLVFEVQIPEAMKLHEAMNGQPPKSHEEFMEKIIKENRIQLPTLPRDQKYVYDPATKQLMVEMPARQ